MVNLEGLEGLEAYETNLSSMIDVVYPGDYCHSILKGSLHEICLCLPKDHYSSCGLEYL